MALADRTPITEPVNNRILILDVERLDGITVQHWWDRGDLKNRYVHHETVTRLPRVTMFGYQWYDDAEPTVLAEWDKGGRPRFLRRIYELLEGCDITVTHNGDRADLPWLRGDLHLEAGLPPLPPFKSVDTLKVLRREFGNGAPFKGLDAVCRILGLPAKVDHYDRDAMERAVTEKSVEDRERLTLYNAGDVTSELFLYDWLRPHIRNHPHLFVDGQSALFTCNRCGSADTLPTAKKYMANVLAYDMLRCARCGGYRRLSWSPERMAAVRGV